MSGLTPKLPMKLDPRQGYTLLTDVKTLASQNFLMLLLTNPGERMMDSNFGVGLKRMLFENFGSSRIVTFEQRLRSQVSRYSPYLQIVAVDYGDSDVDGSLLSISIRIYITPLGTSSNITIESDGNIITS